MRVLLYSKNQKAMKKSGIGRAFYHQKKALELAGVEYTTNPNEKFDVVHINNGSMWAIKKYKKFAPVIVHGHSTHEDFKKSFRLWRFIAPFFYKHLQNIYGNASMIITPTKYSKFLIESMHVVNCPVLAISNGIDIDGYKSDVKQVDLFREKFNLAKDQKVVIGVGLLFERKGLHDFIEVAKTMPDYKFIWFGSLAKIAMTHFIKKAIKNKPDNVIMPGYVTGDIIKGAYQAANCMFFPSYEETEGIVVLEALAKKTPLIVRDIPVYYDWLTDNVNVLKGHNNDQFKELIEKVSHMDTTDLTKNGYEVAQMRSLEIIGQQLKSAYELAINGYKK